MQDQEVNPSQQSTTNMCMGESISHHYKEIKATCFLQLIFFFLIDKHTENILRKWVLKRQPKAYREYTRGG